MNKTSQQKFSGEVKAGKTTQNSSEIFVLIYANNPVFHQVINLMKFIGQVLSKNGITVWQKGMKY